MLHAGDSFDKVTRNFHVGLPQGVSWSVAPADSPITQEGQLMRWKTENFFGDVTLTARCGDFSHSWLLKATATTGCDTLDADTKEVARQLWFNLDGLQTARPEQADGNVYIVVTIYRDGTADPPHPQPLIPHPAPLRRRNHRLRRPFVSLISLQSIISLYLTFNAHYIRGVRIYVELGNCISLHKIELT